MYAAVLITLYCSENWIKILSSYSAGWPNIPLLSGSKYFFSCYSQVLQRVSPVWRHRGAWIFIFCCDKHNLNRACEYTIIVLKGYTRNARRRTHGEEVWLSSFFAANPTVVLVTAPADSKAWWWGLLCLELWHLCVQTWSCECWLHVKSQFLLLFFKDDCI